MNLLMTFSRSRPIFLRSVLRTGIISAAAVAGYLSFLPDANRAARNAEGVQAAWAGGIERPIVELPPSSPAVTSASYLDMSTSAAASEAKKTAVMAAATQLKPSDKPAQRPRRSQDEAAKLSEAATGANKRLSEMGASARSDVQLIASADTGLGGERSFSSRLLSPVAERLPSSGSLLRPFHVVGDVVHNLIKSF